MPIVWKSFPNRLTHDKKIITNIGVHGNPYVIQYIHALATIKEP